MFGEKAVERKDTPLAVVLRAQNEDGIFDGHDQRDSPDHQRDAAQHVGRRLCSVGAAKKQLVHGVERRRADIAVDDA